MALLEQLSRSDPRLAQAVVGLDEQLRARYGGRSKRSIHVESEHVVRGLEFTFARANLASAAKAVLASSTPPAGIYGAGVVEEAREHHPAVFVVDTLLHAAGVVGVDVLPWRETGALAQYLQSVVGVVPDDTLIVGLELPEEQVAPSDVVVCLGNRGTCGIVATVGASRAIVTAGHVARPLGVTVDDALGRVGRVTRTDALAQHSPGEVCADAAVVELAPDVQAAGGPLIAGVGVAQQFDAVTAFTPDGPRTAWLRAPIIPSFALKTTGGGWKDVFLTSDAISQKGDSGAPVLLADGSGTVVGLVVAGAPSYTIIQDISYVLAETQATFVATQ